jgi:hypothetical protein
MIGGKRKQARSKTRKKKKGKKEKKKKGIQIKKDPKDQSPLRGKKRRNVYGGSPADAAKDKEAQPSA